LIGYFFTGNVVSKSVLLSSLENALIAKEEDADT